MIPISRFGALARTVKPVLGRSISAYVSNKNSVQASTSTLSVGVNSKGIGAPMGYIKRNIITSTSKEETDIKPRDNEIMTEFSNADKGSWTLENYENTARLLFNDIKGAIEVLQAVKSKGLKPSGLLYSHIIRVGVKNLTLREIVCMFSEGSIPIGNAKPSESYQAIEQVYKMAKEDGFKLEQFVYERVCWILSHQSHYGWIRRIMDVMERNGVSPNTRMLNNLLHCYAETFMTENLKSLYGKMKAAGSADAITEANYMLGLCKAKLVDEALKQFELMKTHNIVGRSVYNMIIGLYLKTNNPERAMIMYSEMKNAPDSQPNEITFVILANHFASVQNEVGMEYVIDEFQKATIPFNEMLWGTMLRLAARVKVEAMDSIFKQMKENITPKTEVELYNAVLTIVLDPAYYQTAKEKAAGFLVSESYSPVENSFLGNLLQHFSETEKNLIYAMESKNVTPNHATYDIIMKHLAFRVRNHEAVKQLFEKMTSLRMRLSRTTLNCYLHSLIKMKDEHGIRKVLDMIRLNKYSVSTSNRTSLEAIYGPAKLKELTTFERKAYASASAQ